MKIGDVLKINIEGRMTLCIVLGDMIKDYNQPLPGDVNYLSVGDGPGGHKILNDQVHLRDYYKTLIGDKIVYVETRDISE